MKINTLITIETDSFDLVIKLNPNNKNWTDISSLYEGKVETTLTIENKEITEFIEALNKHKEIHGV